MGPSGRIGYILHILDCLGHVNAGFIQVLYLGRALRTKETLPDFREKCRVTRHSRVFRGLTGSQRTPGFWVVTAWYQSLGIRIPRELGFGVSITTRCGSMLSVGMRLPRKNHGTKLGHYMHVFCVFCVI